jgi:hypothetical protein
MALLHLLEPQKMSCVKNNVFHMQNLLHQGLRIQHRRVVFNMDLPMFHCVNRRVIISACDLVKWPDAFKGTGT